LPQADIFYTHVQADCPLSSLNDLDPKSRFKMYTMPKRWSASFIPKDPKYWIDYVSLRQCQEGAFVPATTVKLIREIGLSLVKIPSLLNDPKTGSEYHYTARSFTMLEAYATLRHGARMLVILPSVNLRITRQASSGSVHTLRMIDANGEEKGIPDQFALREHFKSNPIDSANAKARGGAKQKQVPRCHMSYISHIYSIEYRYSSKGLTHCGRVYLYKSPTYIITIYISYSAIFF
jgi:hypothetical protein